ncbi:MAG: DUF1622 domain-containing protein [Pyrinomonadaceae bacterium]
MPTSYGLWIVQEGVRIGIQTPKEAGAEDLVYSAVLWLKLAVEITGAIVIGLGIVAAVYQFSRALMPPQLDTYNGIRLTLARYLALALEFQLGADILSTAIAPSWDQIGKLGAIAVIRTTLNYFLTREMQDERAGATKMSVPGIDAPPPVKTDEAAR